MNEGAPKQLLPRMVNPRKLAYQGVKLVGSIRAEDLSILVDAVDEVESAEADLHFYISDDSHMVVEGKVCGRVVMQCQRCLQPMPVTELQANVKVAVVRTEEDAAALPKSLDPWVVPDDEADLIALVQEELLLSLPVVAYHAEACVDKSWYSSGDFAEVVVEEKKPNPFSVLGVLKQNGKPE